MKERNKTILFRVCEIFRIRVPSFARHVSCFGVVKTMAGDGCSRGLSLDVRVRYEVLSGQKLIINRQPYFALRLHLHARTTAAVIGNRTRFRQNDRSRRRVCESCKE